MVIGSNLIFLFSSRRRHTRSKRDWSSDVCSSDLDGDRFVPVGWDRGAQLVGACIAAPDGTAVAYDVVGEDAQSARTPMEPGIAASSVQSNGSAVLAIVNGTVVRVWTIGSYGD